MNNEIRPSLVSTMPAPKTASRSRAASEDVAAKPAANAAEIDRTRRADSDRAPAQETTTATGGDEPQRNQVEQAAQELARRAEKMGRDLRFEVDDDSGMTVVKVIDRMTEEVVRQIPSEEAVSRAADTAADTLNLIDAKA